MMDLFFNFWKKFKWNIISTGIALLSIFLLSLSVSECNRIKKRSEHNIDALVDTIRYYKDKNGDIVAKKLLLEGDFNLMKKVNDSLYNVVKDMKIKNPTTVIYTSNEIDYGEKDTFWIVKVDTISANPSIKKEFSFNNEYRILEGNVSYKDSLLGLNIDKDITYFDYTLAVKNSEVYIKSSNPYVKYKEITGITLPEKKYRFSLGVGPSVGYGYNFVTKSFNSYVGISVNLNYNLLQFGRKK